MNKKELVDWIQSEITVSGQIQISVPDKEIERIVDKEMQMIPEMYPDALQDSYTILPVEVFRHPDFRNNRTIQFPKCVKSIVKFEEMKRRNAMFGFADSDLCVSKIFASDAFLSQPFNLDTITYRTMSYSVWDQMKAYSLVDIQFDYNRLTNRLLVLGHDPRYSVFVVMKTVVPDENLWEDPWVKKWLAAKCMYRVYPLIGTFTTTLIGGTTINAAIYKELAEADLTECKEYFKQINQATYFLDFP